MASGAPVYLKEEGELGGLLETNAKFVTALSFIAPWSENCMATGELTRELAADPDMKQVLFVELEAEEFPSICKKYGVDSVPTIVFIRNQKEVSRLKGGDVKNYAASVASMTNMDLSVEGVPVRTVAKGPAKAQDTGNGNESLEDRLRRLTNQHSVMVFMKGNPTQPRCGFSRQVIEILNGIGVSYKTFDILEDEEVRQGLKEFSQWQTYPQLYVNGTLVGGLDIIRDMKEMGNLEDVLNGKEPI